MPFGLCNAPATFERLMERVLRGLQWQVAVVYLDDVIVWGRTFEEHYQRLATVLGRFRTAGLKLKPKKCDLFKTEVSFLGHLVSAEGVRTDPAKVAVIRSWPRPANVTQVRSFLGLASYYRRFIAHFAEIARPLHALTNKSQREFVWTDACQMAFEHLQDALATAPVLRYPNPGKRYILDTDASNCTIGAVLSQEGEHGERVVAYGSRVLSKAERNYCTTRKELLAVVHFVHYFKHYLFGKRFPDHGSLRWLFNFKEPEGQTARWL